VEAVYPNSQRIDLLSVPTVILSIMDIISGPIEPPLIRMEYLMDAKPQTVCTPKIIYASTTHLIIAVDGKMEDCTVREYKNSS
jgi:hypothetical protein